VTYLNDCVNFTEYTQFTNVAAGSILQSGGRLVADPNLYIWTDRIATAHFRSKSPFVQYKIYRYFKSLDKSGNYL